ncbi:MAG TPA: hypothetical protein VGB45_12935 [Abditibacterium sp.]|jgi:hypothetical protein
MKTKLSWTRGEKLLFLAPLFFIVVAGAFVIFPDAFRRAVGWPLVLSSPGGEYVDAFAWSSDSRSLALCVGKKDGRDTPDTFKVMVFDAIRGHKIRDAKVAVPLRHPPVTALVPYRKDEWLRVAPFSGVWRVDSADPNALTVPLIPTISRQEPFQLHFSADFSRALVISHLGARMWEANSNVWKPALDLGKTDESALQGLSENANSALLISDSDATYRKNFTKKRTSHTGHKLRSVETRSGKIRWELPFHNVSAAVFSRDNRTVYFGVSQPEPSDPKGFGTRPHSCWVGAVNAATGTLIWKSQTWLQTQIISLAVAPRGESLSVHRSLNFLLLDPLNGQIVRELEIKPALDRSKSISHSKQFFFSPDAKSLATHLNGRVYVWNVEK